MSLGEGTSGWVTLGSHPHRPIKGQLSAPAGLRGVGGRTAEALVPMETAGFRMLLALVLVQMGWGQGAHMGEGQLAAPQLTPSIVLSMLMLPPYPRTHRLIFCVTSGCCLSLSGL